MGDVIQQPTAVSTDSEGHDEPHGALHYQWTLGR